MKTGKSAALVFIPVSAGSRAGTRINMDINILLVLQDFRNGAGAFLSDFFSKMTFLGELTTAMVLMAIIYWSVSKDFGSYLLMDWSGNRLVNGVLKVTACAYRPWIRDARIVPYGNSMTTATGYSFPSGHTMNAASTFGGVAVRKDMPRVLRLTMGLTVLLVAFSRNFLGVHVSLKTHEFEARSRLFRNDREFSSVNFPLEIVQKFIERYLAFGSVRIFLSKAQICVNFVLENRGSCDCFKGLHSGKGVIHGLQYVVRKNPELVG